MDADSSILYVNKKTKTGVVFEAVKKHTSPEGASKVVIASHKGKAALKLAEVLGKQVQVVSVTEFTYDDDTKKDMKKLNVVPVEKASLPIQDDRAMRETLMMFGSGVKAAMEVAAVASSKKLVGGQFIAVAGEKEGFDTVLILDTEHPQREQISDPLKQMRVKRFIALPE
ncbi:MAG: hypothetical protein ABIJ47_15970 [Candidatus Bathyarchaeota archaeon]